MKLIALWPLTLGLSSLGCGNGGNCSAVGGVHTQLYVVDAATSAPLCDAMAAAPGIDSNSSDRACGFILIDAPPGDYQLSVVAGGHKSKAVIVEITADECQIRHIHSSEPADQLPVFADTVSIGLDAT